MFTNGFTNEGFSGDPQPVAEAPASRRSTLVLHVKPYVSADPTASTSADAKSPRVIPPPPPCPPPPPPPPRPGKIRNGSATSAATLSAPPVSNGKRESIAGPRHSISLLSGALLSARRAAEPVVGTKWHDAEVHNWDKAFLVTFPALFVVFNLLYWPFLMKYPVIFPDHIVLH